MIEFSVAFPYKMQDFCKYQEISFIFFLHFSVSLAILLA